MLESGSLLIHGEPALLEVLLPQRRLAQVEVVHRLDQPLHPLVFGVLEQVPVDAAIVRPLLRLGDLAALEKELFARVGPHPGKQRTQVGVLLPAIPGHLA